MISSSKWDIFNWNPLPVRFGVLETVHECAQYIFVDVSSWYWRCIWYVVGVDCPGGNKHSLDILNAKCWEKDWISDAFACDSGCDAMFERLSYTENVSFDGNIGFENEIKEIL